MKHSKSVIQLEHYFLDKVKFQITEIECEKKIDINPSFSVNKDKGIAQINLDFSIEEDIFKVEGVVVGFFSYSEGINEEEIESLLVINGVTILFPYLRSAVSNISNAANVPTIIIPTVNIIEFLKEKPIKGATK